MKNIRLFLFITIVLFSFCSKEIERAPTISLEKQQITKKWQGVNSITEYYVSGIKVDSLSENSAIDYFSVHLKDDNTYTASVDTANLDDSWQFLTGNTQVKLKNLTKLIVPAKYQDFDISEIADLIELSDSTLTLKYYLEDNILLSEIQNYTDKAPSGLPAISIHIGVELTLKLSL